VNPLEDAVNFILQSCHAESNGQPGQFDVHEMVFKTVTVRHLVDSILTKRVVDALAKRVFMLENLSLK
jgi:hypothetical protein